LDWGFGFLVLSPEMKFDGQEICHQEPGVHFEIGPKSGSIGTSHYHDHFYQVDLILSGSCTDLHRKNAKRIQSGMIDVFNPSDPHRVDYENTRSAVFAIETDKMTELVRNLGGSVTAPTFNYGKGYEFVLPLAEANIRVSALWAVHKQLEANPDDTILSWKKEESVNTLLELTLRSLCRTSFPLKLSEGDYHHGIAKRTRDWMESNYSDHTLRLKDLAAVSGLSDFHFSRIFQKEMGCAPYQYLQKIRIRRAKRMISSTKIPLTRIAMDTGFASVQQLNNHFRNCLGYDPLSLRKSSKQTPGNRDY
jgi:AraC-like DNA-binding protein